MLQIDYGIGCLDKARPLINNLSAVDRAIAANLTKEAFLALLGHALPADTNSAQSRWSKLAAREPYAGWNRFVMHHQKFLFDDFVGTYTGLSDLHETLCGLYNVVGAVEESAPDIVSDILLDMNEPITYDMISKYLPREMDHLQYNEAESYVRDAIFAAQVECNDKRLYDCVEHYLQNLNERCQIRDVLFRLPKNFLYLSAREQQSAIEDIVSKF